MKVPTFQALLWTNHRPCLCTDETPDRPLDLRLSYRPCRSRRVRFRRSFCRYCPGQTPTTLLTPRLSRLEILWLLSMENARCTPGCLYVGCRREVPRPPTYRLSPSRRMRHPAEGPGVSALDYRTRERSCRSNLEGCRRSVSVDKSWPRHRRRATYCVCESC